MATKKATKKKTAKKTATKKTTKKAVKKAAKKAVKKTAKKAVKKPAKKVTQKKAAAKKNTAKKTAKSAVKKTTKAAAAKTPPKAASTRRPSSRHFYEVEPQVKNPRISKGNLNKILKQLMIERERLVGEMTVLKRNEYSQMTSDQSHRFANHTADLASNMAILDTLLIQSGIEGDRLRQVQDALERLEHGTLGTCERCGGNIGYERMLAKPFARYCIICRAYLEKKQRRSTSL